MPRVLRRCACSIAIMCQGPGINQVDLGSLQSLVAACTNLSYPKHLTL